MESQPQQCPHQGCLSLILTQSLPAVCHQLWLPAAFGENMEKEDGVEEGGVLPVGAARVAEAWGLFKAAQGSVPGGGSRDLIAPLPFAGVSAASGLAPIFIHSG